MPLPREFLIASECVCGKIIIRKAIKSVMDKKEKLILKHYRVLIESNEFDEYDILGFLIFIRRHLNYNEYPNIREFSDLIAHRIRDRGRVNECIVVAIEGEYQTEKNSKIIRGYNGMDYKLWVNEWKNIGNIIDIKFSDEIIEDLTVCVFSLAQFTCYNDKEHRGSGRLELFIGKDGSLALATTEGNPRSLYICYSMFGNFTTCREISAGHLRNPVEAVRVNGKIRLKDSEGYII